MWQALHDAWWRLATCERPASLLDALACAVLRAAAGGYRLAVAARDLAYACEWAKPARLPCRVISVGNLTVGGTGKTACVELVSRMLQTQGRHVAILSRGYGGRSAPYWLRHDGARLTVNGQSAALDGMADEPQLLARRLPGVPVLVGARRARNGELACREFAADTVVLDDGFQHRRLHRDLDIVLVHARTPFGGWPLLPRGPMREPLAALRRAQVLIITKADEALEMVGALGERLRTLAPEALILSAGHAPSGLTDAFSGTPMELSRLEGACVGLVSSIGDPSGFEATIRRLHATVSWHRALPDHHRYTAQDWTRLCAGILAPRPAAVVTTQKDWVRLEAVVRQGAAPPPVPLWVLGVEMRLLEGHDALAARLAGLHGR